MLIYGSGDLYACRDWIYHLHEYVRAVLVVLSTHGFPYQIGFVSSGTFMWVNTVFLLSGRESNATTI